MGNTSDHDDASIRDVKQCWAKEAIDVLKRHRLGKNPIRFKKIAQILNDIAIQRPEELGRCDTTSKIIYHDTLFLFT